MKQHLFTIKQKLIPVLRRGIYLQPLNLRLRGAVNRKNLEQTLSLMAQLETRRAIGPHEAGGWLVELFATDDGVQRLGAAAARVHTKAPRSVLLVYLRTIALAKAGQFQTAHDFVQNALTESREPETINGAGHSIANKRTIGLWKVWRVLDAIARDDMTWAGRDVADQKGYWDLANAFRLDDGPHFDGRLALHSAEPLLQGRHQERYLDICRTVFDRAESTAEKLDAIRAMWRQGQRRVPDFQAAYSSARECFGHVRPVLVPILQSIERGEGERVSTNALSLARLLRSALGVANQLGFTEDRARIESALLVLASSPGGQPAIWMVASALIEMDPNANRDVSFRLVRDAGRAPKSEQEAAEFLKWANLAGEYEWACDVFRDLPAEAKRQPLGLSYATILQNMSRFDEAATAVSDVHAALLAWPSTMCPLRSWNMIRRAGELRFAAETAMIYSRVPQPSEPKGVLFVMPRTIEQLRRLPLVVLMELKRRGWAVVPLVEGMLPAEPTGIETIDRYNGCLMLSRQIKQSAREWLNDVDDLDVDLNEATLTWRGMDFSHALREEAMVNRRRYDVDHACPALRKYLGNHVGWARIAAPVLDNLREDTRALGLRAGFMVLYNNRLPDILARFYCETFGDPDSFFCLHSADGYQNYFVNFTTNVSTRSALCNMTRHSDMRSANFPVPSLFGAYYQENRTRARQILANVREVTKMRRSTGRQKGKRSEALVMTERIRSWRSDGGKVACAFGKVVCDLDVPFDGGPAHSDMKDWLNHTIESARDSGTLLIIKPHPHETREEIACFLTQTFFDLIDGELPPNVGLLDHDWFDIHDLDGLIDLALIYNGTTAVEMGVLGIPSVLCAHFAPIDYPVGHCVPSDRNHYRRLVRFEASARMAPDLVERSALWLDFMGGDAVSRDYRYHARQITNKVVYPPWWFKEDIGKYLSEGDPNVTALADEAISMGIRPPASMDPP